VNPLLAGILVLGVTWAVIRRFGFFVLGVGAGLALAVNIDLLVYGASALSEPLFVVLALGGLWAVAFHLEGEDRCVGWLVLGGVLVSLSVLTRYIGVAVALAGAVVLVRAGRRRDGVLFMVVTMVPISAWIAWAGGTNRPLAVHGLVHRDYLMAGRAVSRWFLPVAADWPLRMRIGIVFMLALVSGWFWLGRREGVISEGSSLKGAISEPGLVLESALAIFAVLYLTAMLGSRLFFDFSNRFDGRAFLPLLPVMVLLTTSLLARLRLTYRMPAGLAVTGIGLLLIGLQMVQAVRWVNDGRSNVSVERRGYTAVPWRQSEVVAQVDRWSASMPVYSNGADVLFFLTGRRTEMLPSRLDYLTGRANPRFAREMQDLEADLRRRGGAVVY
ncbi:MAG: hypothetical protein ACRDRT_13730, partial [Pseudonocardiaceae bacterium]